MAAAEGALQPAHKKSRGRGNRWTPAEIERFRRMWNENVSAATLAEAFGSSRGAVYQRAANDAECKKRTSGRRPARDRRPNDTTKQRRFTGTKHATGTSRVVIAPHHPASRKGTTLFPSSVVPAATLPRLLKGGENSRKIGKEVEKGHWRGMPIFTLTLEERDTCPRSCKEWATCYGNNTPFAQRILDDGTLTRRLWGELASHAAAHPGGFLVRLHVLGDFFSVEYVEFWRQALQDFPPLRIFGFTARLPKDPIGAALVHLVRDEQERVALRFSGGGYETHCSEVVDRPEDAAGILCPAQQDADRSCATCGLCWATTRTISFLRH